MSTASAQGVDGEGWPPPSPLLNDTLILVRIAPFIIALAIVIGIFQARQAIQKGGDAIIGEKVRRHDLSTVIAHWTNATGVILGVFTGAVVLRYVDYRPEGLRLIFILHYVGAGLILFGIFNHLSRHGVSGGTGLIPKSFGVLRDLIGELLEYAGLFGPKSAALRIPWPRAIRHPVARYFKALTGYNESRTGKYLVTEQILSYPPWAILMGIVVVTGVIKLLKYLYEIPGSVVTTATTIHDLATIAVGIMIVIHLLPLLIVPANWMLLLSMFKTTVSRKYVEERHPAWYKSLSIASSREKAAQPASPEHVSPQTADA
jgi:cytochrome b subunit of formate dehydrogenase